MLLDKKKKKPLLSLRCENWLLGNYCSCLPPAGSSSGPGNEQRGSRCCVPTNTCPEWCASAVPVPPVPSWELASPQLSNRNQPHQYLSEGLSMAAPHLAAGLGSPQGDSCTCQAAETGGSTSGKQCCSGTAGGNADGRRVILAGRVLVTHHLRAWTSSLTQPSLLTSFLYPRQPPSSLAQLVITITRKKTFFFFLGTLADSNHIKPSKLWHVTASNPRIF